jgi:hypothetical protein
MRCEGGPDRSQPTTTGGTLVRVLVRHKRSYIGAVMQPPATITS